jgi:CDP-diacylglycerol--serine O-phosphatidyltransferase
MQIKMSDTTKKSNRKLTIFNWRQAIPSFITLLAMLAGFLSILVTIEGMSNHDPHLFRLAAQLIMLSMILDGLDGNIARKLNGVSEFGAELDTYVDMTAFGIAPAILIFAVSTQMQNPFLRILLPSAVALSGVVRLARFKVKDPLRGQGGYAGLPITANAGWVALFVFITQTPPLDKFNLDSGYVSILFLLGVFSFVVLQVSNLRYPKPTKKMAIFIPCVVLVILFVFMGKNMEKPAMYIAILMLIMCVGYIALGPLFVKTMNHKNKVKDTLNDKSE